MMQVLNELRFGHSFFRLMQDPTRTEEVFKLSEIGLHLKPAKGVELAVARATADPGFQRLFAERYRAPAIDFAELAALPEKTLGKQYELHMTRNGLKPDFFWPTACKTEVEYLINRGREVHDIWHVLTGYDTSFADEIALQAFTMSHIDSPISAVIVANGILHAVRFEPENLGTLFTLVNEGFERGRQAQYMLGVRWEDCWEMPLDEARAWMKIPPRTYAGLSGVRTAG